MNDIRLPKGFIDDEDEMPSYTRNSWEGVTPQLAAAARSKRTEAEGRAGVIRCPECGDVVPTFFEHVDMDCTGHYPEKVAAGHLRPRP